MTDRLRIVVCRRYAGEARAAVDAEGLGDVAIVAERCVCDAPCPAALGRPGATAGPADAQEISLLGGQIHAAAPVLAALPAGVHRRTAHCLDRLLPAGGLHVHVAPGGYAVSPGWLREWELHLAQWGFDRSTAHEFFSESATQVVLIDTGIDPHAAVHLRQLAAFVGVPYEILPVGLAPYRTLLAQLRAAWHLASGRRPAAP